MSKLPALIVLYSLVLWTTLSFADTIIFLDGSTRNGAVSFADGVFTVKGRLNGAITPPITVAAVYVKVIFINSDEDNLTAPPLLMPKPRGPGDTRCKVSIVGSSNQVTGVLKAMGSDGVLVDKTRFPRERVVSIRIISK